jgi:hypothetical protein
MAHGGLEHFHIDVVAAGQLDFLTNLFVMCNFVSYLCCFFIAITCVRHFVREVRVSSGPQAQVDTLENPVDFAPLKPSKTLVVFT